MKDTDLYSWILGLAAPWFVDAVKPNTVEGRVDIHVEHSSGVRWACPVCGRELSCRDLAEPRVWRHLDTCQFKTFLHARIPRVDCPEHGVLQVNVPWAEPKGRFTLLMERLIIDVLTECATLTGARRIMRITWDEAWGVMERAVRRGRERKQSPPSRYLGVDEKTFRKGHDYVTVVCDLVDSTVEYVADERKTESLEGYYLQFTKDQLARIKAVAMDMREPYFKATLKHVPGAAGKIVHDRFHIMKHVSEAVDRVRKQEHRELMGQEDHRLRGTKYLWLYREENLPDKHRAASPRGSEGIKPQGGQGLSHEGEPERRLELPEHRLDRQFVKRWLTRVNKSGLAPMQKVGGLIQRHVKNIRCLDARRGNQWPEEHR
jgi:transposase